MDRTTRVAVDVGGTFTDVVRLDPTSGELVFDKVPTTPEAPTTGVLAAFVKVDAKINDVVMFTHGTTLGLNALLTRTGARIAVIGTRGFRDVYLLGRTDRRVNYDITYRKPPALLERYDTFEVSMNRRYSNGWSASVGGSYTWMDDFPATVANSWPRNPNLPGQLKRTTWNFKATGSYDAPYGIRISPVLRHQSGVNFGREISVPGSAATAFGLVLPASTIYADDTRDNRGDNIWVFDVRAEKTVNLGPRFRTRLFLDFFNITNSHASETITRTTGANFRRPANILAPFTTRLGFRLLW